MKLFRRLFNDEVSEIIKLTELKQEVKNLLFVIVYEIQHRNTKYGKEWNYSVTSQHRSQGFDYMITQIRELLKENKQMKEENEKLKQELSGYQKEPKTVFEVVTGLGATQIKGNEF